VNDPTYDELLREVVEAARKVTTATVRFGEKKTGLRSVWVQMIALQDALDALDEAESQ
jgi:hypothetical protein